MGQAIQLKRLRSGNGFPDITIYESNVKYSALFLEVKKESPFKKDGKLKKSAHLQEQNLMHKRLRAKGYKVLFVWRLEQVIQVLKEYLK